MTDHVPLGLQVMPGDYRCTWTMPVPGENDRSLPGNLELNGGRPPSGSMHGNVPVVWTESNGTRSAGFPQHITLAILHGQLVNGRAVALIDVTVTVWASDRAFVHARAALAGQVSEAVPDDLLFDGATVQVRHLDCLAGLGPLKSLSFPASNAEHLLGTWSVTGEPGSTQAWSDEDTEVSLQFDGSISLGDPFGFHMSFSPVVVLTNKSPTHLDEWISDWVEPLRRLVCLATGGQEDTTYLAVDATSEPNAEQRWLRGLTQVFGPGLAQDPFASSQKTVQDRPSVFTTAGDGLSLLQLLRTWQGLAAQHHPLLETYGAFLGGRPQHPRAQYLLLIQALEGLHGFETRTKFEAREQRHLKQRGQVLAAATENMGGKDLSFLRKHLRRTPPSNLDTALRGCIRGLPVDLSTTLDDTQLVRRMRREDPRQPGSMPTALALVRNDLAHGSRGYDVIQLGEVVRLLERVARAHLLRILGCPQVVQQRALAERP